MEGLRQILEAIQKGEHAQLLTLDGKPIENESQRFTTKPVYALPKNLPDMPATLKVYSLTGLVDYLDAVQPLEGDEDLFVHVEGPRLVSVCGKLIEHKQRRTYLQAVYDAPEVRGFQFNAYCEQESMMIALLSLFKDSEELAEVVKRIGNLAAETVKTSTDDGITQQVVIRTGLRTESAVMPGVVHLHPFSTFAEVEQPARRFLLRLRGNKEGALPTCGLWEADNGAWANTARQSIAKYIADQFKERRVEGVEVIA